jgi:hypothetical protein
MKKALQAAFFVAFMFSVAIGCQSKKEESTATTGDTTTVVESETIVSGDSAEVVTDSATLVPADTTK